MVEDPALKAELKVPEGFSADIHTSGEYEQVGMTIVSFPASLAIHVDTFASLFEEEVYVIDYACTPARDSMQSLQPCSPCHTTILQYIL